MRPPLFGPRSISQIDKSLAEGPEAFPERRLSEASPHLIPGPARDERVREGGVIANRAALVAVAADLEGRRRILAVELAGRESRASGRDLGLRRRGRSRAGLAVSDGRAGLKAAIREILPAGALAAL